MANFSDEPGCAGLVTDRPVYETGSYRDRSGRVFYHRDSVYRALSNTGLANWRLLKERRFFTQAMATGDIVQTEETGAREFLSELVGNGSPWDGVLRHELIPFVSYPYEWTFGMLRDAALLQLRLLDAALDEGMILKDGSAFNLQFSGAMPVFIDIPSFVEFRAGSAWAGYSQFCRTMLFPLMLQAYKNIGFQSWLRGNIEGIDAQECSRIMGCRGLTRRGVFSHVYLQALLQRLVRSTSRKVASDLAKAGFHKELIKTNIRRLQRVLGKLRWRQSESAWSRYADQNSYNDAAKVEKEEFVREVTMSQSWKLCWDLGCNTGSYSRIASENSDYVVAIDQDHLTVETLYRSLRHERNRRILPLVMNTVNRSPAQGWRGLERMALEGRRKPDLILCLALIHHVVLGGNVLLSDFIDWLAEFESDLVIEFITRDDPMVQTLLQQKTETFEDYDLRLFEESLGRHFEIVRQKVLNPQTRLLYHARIKRS